MAVRYRSLLCGVALSAVSAAQASAAGPSPDANLVKAAAPASSKPAEGSSAPAQNETIQEVVVTGSRIATSTFQTPTPVTTVSSEQLKARAVASLVDLLPDLPTVRPGMVNAASTNIGAAVFDMRSLGSIRTLTMIDGRRLMDSNPAVSPIFDINLIPAALIKNMEIVTAGASSVYGSDAVTGVVNIMMDSDLVGGRFDAQASISQRGDNATRAVNAAYGLKFAGDRGHLVAAASYYERPDILYQGSRDWGSTGVTLLANPGYTTTNGQYRQLILPGATVSKLTNGGLIINATRTNGTAANDWAFRGITFGPGGAQSQFQTGQYNGAAWMLGGGGLMTQPDFGTIASAVKRYNGFARATYDVTPDVQGFAEVLYAETWGHWTNVLNYDSGTLVFRPDNAYLPANIRQSMLSQNIASFTLGRTNEELGLVNVHSHNTYLRPAFGLAGQLAGSWKWDASAVLTKSTYRATVKNNRNEAKWKQSVDAVVGPNGQPICRSTLTDAGNGCVPVNLFGEDTITPQAIAWFGGEAYNYTVANGLDVSANIGGKAFSLPAGPVGVSVGVEFRKEDLDLSTDPVSAVNGWRQAGSGPYSGEVSVKEVYGEASVPLLKDVPFADYVELSLAGRFVDYSTSGQTQVYKVGLNWTVNDQVRLRGTYSRDFRAPKLSELFAAPFETQGGTATDRTNNQTVPIRTVSGGNPDLKPEVAKTLTFGIVLQPELIPRLRFSIDYFDIQLDDAISNINAQDVIDRCFDGAQQFCAGITRDSVGAIFKVKTISYNATYLKTSGLDLAVSYALPLDAISAGWKGDLSFTTNATYTAHLETRASGLTIDRAGQLTAGGTPHWRTASRLTYQNEPWTVSVLGDFIGRGKYDTTYGSFDINRNDYPAYYYLGANVAYDVNETVVVFGKIDNLLDTDPPLLATASIIRALAAGASPYYDQFGRTFTAGVRLRW